MELNAEIVKKALDWLNILVGYSDESEIAMFTYQLLGILYDTCEELTEKNAIQTITAIELDKQVQRLTEELTKKETEYNELYELAEDLRGENERLRGENVVRLPCKAGDTVYFVYKYKDYGKVFDAKVVSVEYFEENDIYLHCLHYNGYKEPIPCAKYLGKEVFLTREEAEKALKGE